MHSLAMYSRRKCTPASSSKKTILFVGSQDSDVHLLASETLPQTKYHRIAVGDVNGLVEALHQIERRLHDAPHNVMRLSNAMARLSDGETRPNRPIV